MFYILFQDELGSDMDVLHIRGIKMELIGGLDDTEPDTALAKRTVILDGEKYELESPSCQFWYTYIIYHACLKQLLCP